MDATRCSFWLACALTLSSCLGSREQDHNGPTPAADAGEDEGSDAAEQSDPIPDDWRRVRGECDISLRGPQLARVETAIDADYCVAAFAGGDCSYQVEYGVIHDPFARVDATLFAREQVLVQGSPAQLVTSLYRLNSDVYLAGLFLHFVNDAPGYALAATARCVSLEAQAEARIVLQTVDIPRVGTGLCEPAKPQKCSPI